jgi:hypothetical protein
LIFRKKKVQSHKKRKIDVPIEQGMDSSGGLMITMTMTKRWQVMALLIMTKKMTMPGAMITAPMSGPAADVE